ncbi:MAG: GH32 C-terminal domain-containing protein, partial [Thermoguttaceae bacterium]|nr:GH32 C-terminal domain-containing protein [Thermoguttaceae bacterium]
PAREAAPLRLPEGEDLTLRVLVDRPVIELYANDRQGIGRRVYPTNPDQAQGVSLFSDSPVTVKSVRSWKMNPANPY